MQPSMSQLRNIVLGVTLSVLAVGCAQRTVSYDVQIITAACEPPSPMEGVTHFKLRLTGDGIEPIEKVAAVALGTLELPEIPSGANRQLEVRAYVGDPAAGGKLLSLGRSLPFDVPDVVPQDAPKQPQIPVFIRRVNTFTRTASVEKPGTCTRMRDARAGHTATLLPDGRVFVAGGFQMNGAKRVAISKAEIYNPVLGDFSQAQDLGFVSPNQITYASPRAFAAATALNNGQVLVIGGETYTDRGDAAPVKLGLIYDPDFNAYGVFAMLVERTRLAMAKEANGHVLIVGGTDKNGAVISDMEYYDPNAGKTFPVTDEGGANVQLPRIGHNVAPVQDGAFVVVAGGSNGTALQDQVYFFKYENDHFVSALASASSPPRLREKRRDAALVTFDKSNKLVLAGGFDSPTETSGNALSSSEILETGSAFNISDGPTVAAARGDICAAQLPDGRVVTIGGLVNDQVAGQRSDPTVEMLTPTDSGAPASLRLEELKQGRHFHTCTTMKDGSVLVLGGLSVAAGDSTVLQDALIFTPAPKGE